MSVRYICDGCGKDSKEQKLYTFHVCLAQRVYNPVGKREWCLECAETIERFIVSWQPLSKDERR